MDKLQFIMPVRIVEPPERIVTEIWRRRGADAPAKPGKWIGESDLPERPQFLFRRDHRTGDGRGCPKGFPDLRARVRHSGQRLPDFGIFDNGG